MKLAIMAQMGVAEWRAPGHRFDARYRAEEYAAMIKCQKCHAEMDNGALYCDHCGEELSDQPRYPSNIEPFTVPAPAADPARAYSPPPPLRRLPDWIVLHLASGATFTLQGRATYTIGRIGTGQDLPDVDLAPSYGYEAGVSRQHLTIYVEQDGVFVEDMESKNETIQNGFRLGLKQRYALGDGDELKLGGIVMRVEFRYT